MEAYSIFHSPSKEMDSFTASNVIKDICDKDIAPVQQEIEATMKQIQEDITLIKSIVNPNGAKHAEDELMDVTKCYNSFKHMAARFKGICEELWKQRYVLAVKRSPISAGSLINIAKNTKRVDFFDEGTHEIAVAIFTVQDCTAVKPADGRFDISVIFQTLGDTYCHGSQRILVLFSRHEDLFVNSFVFDGNDTFSPYSLFAVDSQLTMYEIEDERKSWIDMTRFIHAIYMDLQTKLNKRFEDKNDDGPISDCEIAFNRYGGQICFGSSHSFLDAVTVLE